MILKLFIRFFLCTTSIACIVMYFPGLSSDNLVQNTLPKSLDNFTPLESLNVSIFEQIGIVPGPESIDFHNGKLVTGSFDGQLYEINPSDNTVKPLLKVAKFKSRPLGLKFDSTGVLFVVDIITGVYKVENVFGDNPKVSLVFDIQQTAAAPGCQPSRFLNDVAVVEKKETNGHILFISDISAKYPPEESMLTILRSDRGRVVVYDTKSKQVSFLDGDFVTPNGVEISADRQSLLFVELVPRTVWRYNLKDGSLKKIISQLPGEPDNIRRSVRGDTFWVAIMNPRSFDGSTTTLDFLMARPLLRQFIVQVVPFFGGVLEKLGQWLPDTAGRDAVEDLGRSLKSLQFLFPVVFPSNGGMMLEIDIDGNIVNSIYELTEQFSMISEVREVPSSKPNHQVFYLASVEKSYIRKLVITK